MAVEAGRAFRLGEYKNMFGNAGGRGGLIRSIILGHRITVRKINK